MITFQDYCPVCKAIVEATPAIGRHERGLSDKGLWRVLLHSPEVLVMHRAPDRDHYWRLSNRTREGLRTVTAAPAELHTIEGSPWQKIRL
jgi:hypothetical protein